MAASCPSVFVTQALLVAVLVIAKCGRLPSHPTGVSATERAVSSGGLPKAANGGIASARFAVGVHIFALSSDRIDRLRILWR